MLQVADVRQDKGTKWYAENDPSTPLLSFIFVTYGSCIYWIGGSKVVLEKGDMLLLSEQASYYGKSIPTVLHEKYVFAFRLTSPLPDLSVLRRTPYVLWKTGMYELLADRCKTASDQWNERLPYRETMAAALLLEMLVHASRELDRGRPAAETYRMAETMRSYIQLHHRERVTKEHLGEAIGKSANYAATVFSSVTGQTISECVHAARIKTASYMLRHSLLTVAEIAEYVGYSDPSYFYRIFKKTTGQLPSALLAERDESAN